MWPRSPQVPHPLVGQRCPRPSFWAQWMQALLLQAFWAHVAESIRRRALQSSEAWPALQECTAHPGEEEEEEEGA